MLRSPRLAAILAAFLLAARPLAAAQGCDIPAEIATEARPLPLAARALARGTLSILALGSASTVGRNGAEAETAWPARFAAALQARYPQARIELSVRAGRGVTAAEHLHLLRDARLGASLVIWQTGTVETVRGLDSDEMSEALTTGIGLIRRAGADVVLMDQQFSRFLRANANVEPYREALRVVAAATGVALLRRYDLMRSWADEGGLDIERAAAADRAGIAVRLNDCLGRALATLVERGLTMAP